MSALDSIYSKLPIFAQHTAVSTYGLYWRWLRFGPGFSKYVNEFMERESWTTDQWHKWQKQHVRMVLANASKHVPYYRSAWSDKQKSAALEGRLEALPLLEKDPLRTNPESFLRQDLHPHGVQIFHTSGSTGTPIAAYYTIPELRQSLALREVRSARWAGVSFRMPRATFSGRIVEPDAQSKGPFYRYNAAEKQVYFSAFHLSPETAVNYLAALQQHHIQWMTGYAVSIYLLGSFIIEQKLKPSPLKAIVTTSEKLTPSMRQVIEKAFGCRVYEEYSTVENAVFASECEHGRLHASQDVSVIEILHPDGSSCAPGETGEIVVTTLTHTYQPLIRFCLGDLAAWDTAPCPCGRRMPVIKEVLGRLEDVVIGPDGRQLVRFHGIFVDQAHVKEGQIIQEMFDRIRVKVVPSGNFGDGDVQDIIQRVQQRLGNQVTVVVEPVNEIPRTEAGKFRAVICNLPQNQKEEARREAKKPA